MKIALVSPYDFAHPGGVVSHIRALDEEFTKLGHDVRVIAPAARKNWVSFGDRFIPIGKPRSIPASGSITRISLSLRLASAIQKALASERFDVVHLHEPFMPMLCSAVLRFSDALNIGTFHAYAGRPGYWLGWPVTTVLLNRRNRKLTGYIAVSELAKKYAAKHVSGEFTVIPNGVDLNHFNTQVSPIPGYDDGKINILFVGRLESRKGVKYLLRAYEKLKKEHSNIRLIIVGPGVNLRKRYEWWVRFKRLKEVVFTGGVSYADLPRYYKTADIFCAPAIGKESFGIILLEAMALGKPIVASSNPGYASVVNDEEQALLVSPRDTAALTEALRRLINDKELRLRMGASGVQSVQQYNWPIVAKRILEYYERMLDGKLFAHAPSAEQSSAV
ncbi:MAG: glycosyltransferase family 4 protein [Dehalococcoidia bacterium]|nr:glycosyltransferase family 4 protein [Dehalococcoidia bacterium]